MKKKIKYCVTITHKQLRKSLAWITGMGSSILIKDMEDTHLINTVLYLNKKRDDLELYNLPMVQVNDKLITEWIDILDNEITFRKLK